MHCPYSFNICPLPHRVLLIVPLITSMGIKIHYSAALPTPHQLSTSLVSTLSKLAMISLFSFSVFLLFVCLFAVISFWFGDICLGVFPPEILLFLLNLFSCFFLLLWYLDSITTACALHYPLQLLFRYFGLSQELVWHVP